MSFKLDIPNNPNQESKSANVSKCDTCFDQKVKEPSMLQKGIITFFWGAKILFMLFLNFRKLFFLSLNFLKDFINSLRMKKKKKKKTFYNSENKSLYI